MNKTNIEWCDYTWNPITGCSPISGGCVNCHARAIANRFKVMFNDFKVTYYPERLCEPSKLKKPSIIFVCSMGDIFHANVQYSMIMEIFNVIKNNPQHQFIILTKRLSNITPYIKGLNGDIGIIYNLTIGVTVESDCYYNRIDNLRETKSMFPNIKSMVSFEPLLSDVSDVDLTGTDWVICGGETGIKAREMKIKWAVSLLSKCYYNKIPFFYKGRGTYSMSKKEQFYYKLGLHEHKQTPFKME